MLPGRSLLTLGVCFARLELAANLVYSRCNARAEVAELADAHGSGPCTRKGVEVQVLSSAPNFGATPKCPGFASGLCCVWAPECAEPVLSYGNLY